MSTPLSEFPRVSAARYRSARYRATAGALVSSNLSTDLENLTSRKDHHYLGRAAFNGFGLCDGDGAACAPYLQHSRVTKPTAQHFHTLYLICQKWLPSGRLNASPP